MKMGTRVRFKSGVPLARFCISLIDFVKWITFVVYDFLIAPPTFEICAFKCGRTERAGV